jgi:hypothetical protein
MKSIVIAIALAAAPIVFAQEAATTTTTQATTTQAAATQTAAAAPAATAVSTVKNVRVEESAKREHKFLEARGNDVVQLGQDVVITVSNWDTLRAVARAAQKPITLHINGRDSALEPVVVSGGGKDADLTFRLTRTDANKDLWRDILHNPVEEARTLHLSVGVSGDRALMLDPTAHSGSVKLDKITLASVGIFWLLLMLGLVGGLIYLSATTDMLRGGPQKAGSSPPYSLARTQMAWWFVLIIVAYILIWTFTGERDTIPVSLLALLGISAATALSSTVIDNGEEKRNASATEELQAQKEKLEATVPVGDPARPAVDNRIADIEATVAARNEPKTKTSFVMDLLTDGNGQIALHRYQIIGWTLVLGFIFIASVGRDLTMPEFNGTLLALMGISSGTYLGFKLPS